MQPIIKIVPAISLMTALLILGPWNDGLSFHAVVGIHLASYLLLGLCFELPELSLNWMCLQWARDDHFAARMPMLQKILAARYVLTHLVASSVGVFAMLSGVYLTYRGGFSFREGWIFWILVASALGFYKGVYQHNGYIRRLRALHSAGDAQGLRRGMLNPFDHSLIFLEFPTYALSFWAALVKPVMWNPAGGSIIQIERSSSVWWAGIAIVALSAFWLVPLYLGVERWSTARA